MPVRRSARCPVTSAGSKTGRAPTCADVRYSPSELPRLSSVLVNGSYQWWLSCAPCVPSDVVSALRARPPQPLIAEPRARPPCCVARDLEQLLQVLLRGQRINAGPELAGVDAGAQPCRDLPVGRLSGLRVDLRHVHVGQRTQTRLAAFVGGRWSTLQVTLAVANASGTAARYQRNDRP